MARRIKSYRDLRVWQKGLELIDELDRIVDQMTSYQRWSIGMQMHRAAFSIVLNIAEGHDHDYSRAYLRSLADAKGSAREVEAGVLVIRQHKYVPADRTKRSLELLDEIGRMLRALRNSVLASIENDDTRGPADSGT